MSEDVNHEATTGDEVGTEPGFGGIVNYYEVFVPRYFPLPGGKQRTRRSAQMLAKKLGLPLTASGSCRLSTRS